jgi:hypothetical protein
MLNPDRNQVPAPHIFSDDENYELLSTLFCYIEYYDITVDSITELVAELAQSQDHTTDAEDSMRRILSLRFASQQP